MTSLLELFCNVDDFCQHTESSQAQLPHHSGQRRRRAGLCESEIMTLLIHFHQSHYRHFKAYYQQHVQRYLRSEFPGLVSYPRFLSLLPRIAWQLLWYLWSRLGCSRGVAFIDSTPIRVCDNRRIERHRVFAGKASRGRNSMGWFFGFKLHLVVNDSGELLAFALTPGNVDDRQPVPSLCQHLIGKLFGDKGYVSQALFDTLWEHGLQLVTKLRSNMKNRLMPLVDRLLLRKRFLIETIYDQLKNISQIEHSRHRSPRNFVLNLLAGLIAYTFQDKKPALSFTSSEVHDLVLLA
jgi:hypothetical protein